MLTLVGLGLTDEKDLSLRGIEAAEKADKIYIELYTGVWKGSLKKLEKIVKKKIFILQRSDLEENSEKILNEAKNKKIILFVQGDPLVATTHSSLLVEARKKKIPTQIIHNSSIVSAVTETGLHIYKFGPTVTIPFPEKTKNILPESIYRTIEENQKRGLHTLCLLDLGGKSGGMQPSEAAKFLLDMEKKFGAGIIDENTKVVVFSSGKKSFLKYTTLNKLNNLKVSPAVIIIPGKLHFSESEFLKEFADG